MVLATGGLGPTSDDMTSEAAAAALGVALRQDDASLEHIRRRWEARGMEMPESNAKQAQFPEGAEVLPNPVGTAPGFAIELGGARIFFLPGVPSERRHLFHESVRPAVAPLGARDSHQVHIRSFGMTESQVGELLRDLDDTERGITIGYRASFPEIEVKVLARGGSALVLVPEISLTPQTAGRCGAGSATRCTASGTTRLRGRWGGSCVTSG